MVRIEEYASQQKSSLSTDAVEFSRFPKPQILREIGAGYYHAVFEHLRVLWSSKVELVPDVELTEHAGQMSFTGEVESFSHVWIKKLRYGAASHHRGRSAQYAYIDNRVPVHIQHIFRLTQTLENGEKLSTGCAIVRRFQPNADITDFPWDLW